MSQPASQPHRITPASRSWGDIRSRCIPSRLTPLQPALFFGMTPWFRSLELAGRWNTHSPGDKGRQHLEAIIPELLYLSPIPFVRNHSHYQQSLCHKPGKIFSPHPNKAVEIFLMEGRVGKVPLARSQEN